MKTSFRSLFLALVLLSVVAVPASANHGTLVVNRSPVGPVAAGTVLGVHAEVENTSGVEEVLDAVVSSRLDGALYLVLLPGSVTTRYRHVNHPSGVVVEGNSPGDRDVVVELDPIAPGKIAEVEFRVRVAAAVPAGVGGDSFPTFLSYSDDEVVTPIRWDMVVPIVAAPRLEVTKDDRGWSFVPGGAVTYDLEVLNSGSQGATGVVLSDTVPAGTRFVVAGSDPRWGCSSGVGPGSVCEVAVGALAVGERVSVPLTLEADPGPVPAGVELVENTAQVADDGAGSGGQVQVGTAVEETPLVAAPELSVSKSDGGAVARPGEVLAYTISFANLGDQDATGVVLEEGVPAGTVFAPGASSPGWVCSPGSGAAGAVCELAVGALAGSGSGTATFAVRVDPAVGAGVDELVNRVEIRDDGRGGADPEPGDDRAVAVTPLEAAPDLWVDKDDGGVTVEPGERVAYRVRYGNEGSQGATGVALREVVPEHSSFVAGASAPGWTCSAVGPGGKCVLLVGDVRAGETGEVGFVVEVDEVVPAGVAEIRNSVTVGDDGANGADIDPGDNGSEETTLVVAAPDLVVSKEDGGVSVRPGEVVVYTVSYANRGNQGATGVVLEERVPVDGDVAPEASSPGWVCAPALAAGVSERLKAERIQEQRGAGGVRARAASDVVCRLEVGELPAGGAGAVTLGVRVHAAVPAGVEELFDVVVIGDDGGNGEDLRPEDNRASESTPVDAAPDLRVGKSDGGATVEPGGVVVYTIDFGNDGDQGATGVVLEEAVPLHSVFRAEGSGPGWVCSPAGAAAVLGDKLKAERIQDKLKAERIQESAAGGDVCSLELGDLPVGASGSVAFAVVVDDPVPEAVTELVNRVRVVDDGGNGPDREPGNDVAEETTPVVRPEEPPGPDPDPEPEPDPEPDPEPAVLDVTMADLLTEDRDGSGSFSGGDLVTYSVAIRNAGGGDAEGVVFQVPVPAYVELVAGSVFGETVVAVEAADGVVSVELEDLAAGDVAGLVWEVVIDQGLPPAVEEIVAQGAASAAGVAAVPSDDPDSVEVDDPTVTVLERGDGGPGEPRDVPALSVVGLVLLGVLLTAVALRAVG